MPYAMTARVFLAALLFVSPFLFVFIPLNASAQDDVQIGRYSTLSPTPPAAQVNPLDAVVRVTFPRAQVVTVGDAVNYLLLRSGYHLGTQQADDIRSILALPLPEVHRQVGLYSVQAALGVLMGKPYSLTVDHARREVGYQRVGAVIPNLQQGSADTTSPLARTTRQEPERVEVSVTPTKLPAVSAQAPAATPTNQQKGSLHDFY